MPTAASGGTPPTITPGVYGFHVSHTGENTPVPDDRDTNRTFADPPADPLPDHYLNDRQGFAVGTVSGSRPNQTSGIAC